MVANLNPVNVQSHWTPGKICKKFTDILEKTELETSTATFDVTKLHNFVFLIQLNMQNVVIHVDRQGELDRYLIFLGSTICLAFCPIQVSKRKFFNDLEILLTIQS